ncbi:DUF883 family protein [Neisseria sp. Dent CA1/247]|uniref:Bacterial protein of uncharacterized function (DUF883) n=1 Tax=Neisseria zoodegmatis TaxID=326523 RepID=A0A1X3CTK2_9NEIS|nr:MULTISPECIES: DUF883 family protein [Neisseria]MDO5070780.1 DUF883 family protein [Neisseria zoodegmatis]OSI10903.1 hypothetical protein BWD10_03035 [Neisseria zoodegmatis]UOO76003.1 DUF883 family protein [Neisseria sp. Dent CA1/247]SNU80138.1 Bacterial protein of uncharacterised function (DUF883) [Neisseria zoodegmatis]SUA35810.1 Bacterial protein of uncharacterised function (DUF883) [Neisseria zoodegmatis]
MKQDFEQQKDELMKEIRSVLSDVEELYNTGVEAGTEEAKALKVKLQDKLSAAKAKFYDFEDQAARKVKNTAKQADELIQDKPYYAMGFAALAGLVVGVLLNRR